jgi:signal peptidase I
MYSVNDFRIGDIVEFEDYILYVVSAIRKKDRVLMGLRVNSNVPELKTLPEAGIITAFFRNL